MGERTYNLTRADIVTLFVTTGTINTLNVTNVQRYQELSSNPAQLAGYGTVYTKTDNKFYYVDDTGERFLLNFVSEDGTLLSLNERSLTPATPSSGTGLIYLKTDNNVYFLTDGGIEYQINSSSFSAENFFSIGGELPGPYPVMRRCNIDTSNGDILNYGSGIDIAFHTDTTGDPDIEIKAYKVWNSVWNDIADFQALHPDSNLIYGKCYYDTKSGAKLCDKYCQQSVMGIASDTFGFGVGSTSAKNYLPIAVSGWTLAYVDKEYESGTPLTNNDNGDLTEIKISDKRDYPERIVAIYKKPELNEMWGPKGKEIKVNGRHWVKVK